MVAKGLSRLTRQCSLKTFFALYTYGGKTKMKTFEKNEHFIFFNDRSGRTENVKKKLHDILHKIMG